MLGSLGGSWDWGWGSGAALASPGEGEEGGDGGREEEGVAFLTLCFNEQNRRALAKLVKDAEPRPGGRGSAEDREVGEGVCPLHQA